MHVSTLYEMEFFRRWAQRYMCTKYTVYSDDQMSGNISEWYVCEKRCDETQSEEEGVQRGRHYNGKIKGSYSLGYCILHIILM